MRARSVAAEALDHLAPDDPAAMRSRRDLLRIHRAMGTRSIVARAWQGLLSPARAGRPIRILEIGAGDGRFLLSVASLLAAQWPAARLTLLDRQDIVSPSTLAGFAKLGWQVDSLVVDVLAWAAQPRPAAPDTASSRYDLITTALFLHHFQGRALDQLLGAVAARTDRFFACEPKRSWLPWAGSHLVAALGANAVTREDAVLSVRAGFRDYEITARWPAAGGPWDTRECAAGLFSHCFSARRAGTH